MSLYYRKSTVIAYKALNPCPHPPHLSVSYDGDLPLQSYKKPELITDL